MKVKLFALIVLMSMTVTFSQSDPFWLRQAPAKKSLVKPSKQNLPQLHTFSLNMQAMQQALASAPVRGQFSDSLMLL